MLLLISNQKRGKNDIDFLGAVGETYLYFLINLVKCSYPQKKKKQEKKLRLYLSFPNGFFLTPWVVCNESYKAWKKSNLSALQQS